MFKASGQCGAVLQHHSYKQRKKKSLPLNLYAASEVVLKKELYADVDGTLKKGVTDYLLLYIFIYS